MQDGPRLSRIVLSIIAVLAVGYFAFRTVHHSAPAASFDVSKNGAGEATSTSKFTLPSGPETYRISQRSTALPRIVQATIDPPDVHVGNKQTLTVVVQDEASIAFVEAQIETDHGTKTVLLGLVGPVADAELAPLLWTVDSLNHLVRNEPRALAASLGKVAHASDAPNLKYQGAWTVEDTHNTKYHTKFIVTDAAGRENSITLAWSDACGIPTGGNWILSSNGNCTISSTDGVDAGNATIDSYTLTLNSGAVFAFNPGYSINITSGAIAIASGAHLQKTYLWVADLDGDLYPGAYQQAQDSQPGIQWRRRSAGSFPDDCNDSNASLYQNVSGGTDADQDGYIAEAAVSVGCVGASTANNGRTYYKASGGSYTWLAAASVAGYTDCDDNNFARQVLQSSALDCDADGYARAAGSSQCVYVYPETINGRTYYTTEAVTCYTGDLYLPDAQILGYPDANDLNSGIH
jgi:hypothetical protein